MNKMKWLLALTSAAALAGCATMKDKPARVEVVSSSQVQITNSGAHQENGQIHVTATLRSTSAATRGVGHVDVEFIDAEGEVLETIKATPNVRQFSRGSARGPSISVRADYAPEEVDVIRLTHHVDTFKECAH